MCTTSWIALARSLLTYDVFGRVRCLSSVYAMFDNGFVAVVGGCVGVELFRDRYAGSKL